VQQFVVEREGGTPVTRRSHVGAVASGNLEVLCEPPKSQGVRIVVTTSVDGFDQTWKATLERFLDRYPVSAEFEINDFGATPAMVSLRLEQALEIAR
jgi:malonate decarboxylase delta subunit